MESYVPPKSQLQSKRCQRLGHTQHNCGYAPRCVAVGGSHLSDCCVTPREQPQCCGCEGNHTANYRVRVKWNETRMDLQSGRPSRAQRAPTRDTMSLRKLSGPGPLPSRGYWASSGATSSEGACS